jgi:threonine synthase
MDRRDPAYRRARRRHRMNAMRFVSTRGGGEPLGFSAGIQQGLAPDGGLYVPTHWPKFSPQDFPAELPYAQFAARVIEPFVAGDQLASQLPTICEEAFNFPVPIVPLEDGRLSVLELFHGPTAAFKDFGARFLAACLTRLRASAQRPLNILVATSGDTGGAVAAAFYERPGITVSVLFPKGLVSPTQERQLTCWGGNVRSFAVRGTFDDCQRMVKEAFLDADLRRRFDLSSANSINLGRLLPQAVYFAVTSLAVWRQRQENASFVIPSGNLGHSVACLWAKQMGFPIGDVVLAHNANRVVPDYLDTGEWNPRRSIATLACSMDVGDPSNFERMRALFPDITGMRSALSAAVVDDEAIRARIRAGYQRYGQIWCPHTATAAESYDRLPAERRAQGRWTLAATAHPAKFREIVEPIIGKPVPVPDALVKLFARPVKCTEIEAKLAALGAALG